MATPNMSLITSTPLVTTGPAWANRHEDNWNLLDVHDHSSGKGVQITPAGINVTTDFSFNNFNATALGASKYVNLAAVLPITDLTSVYAVNGNLYFNNGSGSPVQITNGTSVNVAGVGGITGMGGTSAAVTYSNITKTFTFTQDAGITASMDHGPITIRENVLSANGVTLESPSALAGNYDITLFSALPGSEGLVKISSTGQLSTLAVSGNQDELLRVNAAGTALEYSKLDAANINANAITTPAILDSAVTTAKLNALAVTTAKIDNLAVTTAKIADLNVTKEKMATRSIVVATFPGSATFGPLAAMTFFPTAYTIDVQRTGKPVKIWLEGVGNAIGDGYVTISAGGTVSYRMQGGSSISSAETLISADGANASTPASSFSWYISDSDTGLITYTLYVGFTTNGPTSAFIQCNLKAMEVL